MKKRHVLLIVALMAIGLWQTERASGLGAQAQGRNGIIVSGNADPVPHVSRIEPPVSTEYRSQAVYYADL